MSTSSDSVDQNADFSSRDDLIAGLVLGDLTREEHDQLLSSQELSVEEKQLRDDLSAVQSHLQNISNVSLPQGLRQRVFRSAEQRASNSRLFIVLLAVTLAITGGELYRSKLRIASLTASSSSVSLSGRRSVSMTPLNRQVMGTANAEVVIRPDQDSNLLRASHLRPLPSGRTYRLWALTPSGLKGCVHFLPDGQGDVLLRIPQQPSGNATRLLISIDPIPSSQPPVSAPEQTVLASSI